MRSELGFDDVRDQVEADEAGKWDLTIHRRDLTLRDGKVRYPDGYVDYYPNDLEPTPWATTQMCQRLGIPSGYFRRCPATLQDIQFNYWSKHQKSTADKSAVDTDDHPAELGLNNGQSSEIEPAGLDHCERWLLRVKHNRLRGVLSDRYSRLDNDCLLSCVAEVAVGRFEVNWMGISDETFHLRLVDPSLSRDVLPDDRHMVGIHIANSEVGKRAVTIDAIVFRVICSNGLIHLISGKSLLHQRHIFISEDHLREAVAEAVSHALTTSAGKMERLSWATTEHLNDVDATIERLAEAWNLTQTTQEHVRLALLGERTDQQNTVFGLVNAFTSAAQRLPVDDRYQLEARAGDLLDQGMRHIHSLPTPGSRIPVGSEAVGDRWLTRIGTRSERAVMAA